MMAYYTSSKQDTAYRCSSIFPIPIAYVSATVCECIDRQNAVVGDRLIWNVKVENEKIMPKNFAIQ